MANEARGEQDEPTELKTEIMRYYTRTCLRLVDLNPKWDYVYSLCSIAWVGFLRDDAAMAILCQGEEHCDDRSLIHSAQKELISHGIGTDVMGPSGKGRRKVALREAVQVQEAWEVSALGDADWLRGLEKNPKNPWAECAKKATIDESVHVGKVPVCKERPYNDVLLLYSDAELVRNEMDPAIAPRDSHLCRLARSSLPRGLYGELGPSGGPASERGRAKKGSAKKSPKSKRHTTSRPQREASSIRTRP